MTISIFFFFLLYDNLLLTHFSAADLILMFICDTIFFTFFFGLDQFFKGCIALLVILLLFCVWFSAVRHEGS